MNRFAHNFMLVLVLLGGTSYAQTWSPLTGPYGGDVWDIERDASGNTYIISSQKLYKSANNGDSWQAVTITSPSTFFINDLTIANNKFYGIYYNALYTSTDGTTWTKTATTFPFGSAAHLLRFGPDGFIAVYGSDGIFVSKDEGVTWVKASGDYVYWVNSDRVVSNSAGDLFAVSRNTTDYSFQVKKLPYPGLNGSISSSNWIVKYTAPESAYYATLFANGNSIYLTRWNPSDVLLSTDGGDTWPSVKRNIISTFSLNYFGVSPNGTIYISNNDDTKIYSSPNPSTTDWTIVTPTTLNNFSSTVTGFSFISASTFMVCTEGGGGVFKTLDSGATYTQKSTGITAGQGQSLEVSANGRIIYLNQYGSNGYWTSADNGATLTFITLSDYVNRTVKSPDGTFLLYGSKVYRSDVNGENFAAVNATYYYHSRIIRKAGKLYGVSGNTITTSADNGLTWQDVPTSGWPAGSTAYYIDADASYLYVGIYVSASANYRLYQIPIAGGALTELTEYPAANNMNNLFVAGNKLYATQSSSYYFSTDQGASWTTIGFSGSAVFPISDGTTTAICVGRSGSFYITQNDGLTWNSLLMPLSNSYITDIARDPNSTTANPVYYASAVSSPALKYASKLIVDPATLPEYINFNWQPLGGPYGGAPTDLEVHPDGTLFAITGGQLYKYATGVWTKLNSVSATLNSYVDIEIDNSGKMYTILSSTTGVSTSVPKVYVSVDKGVIWTSRPGTFQSSGIFYSGLKIEKMGDGNLVVLASSGRIFRSIDDGNNFIAVKTIGTNAFSSSNPILRTATFSVASNTTDGVLLSADNGVTWNPRNNGLVQVSGLYQITNMAVAPNGYILAAIADATDANGALIYEIYRSTDQGLNWIKINTPPIARYRKQIMVMPNGDYILGISLSLDMYKSTDQGATWTVMPNLGEVFGYYETFGTDVFIRGTSGGIYKSSDNGTTYTAVNIGMPRSGNDIELLHNKDLILAAQGVAYSGDFGQTWSKAGNYSASRFLVKGDSVLAYGSIYNLLSTDGGKTWNTLGAARFFNNIVTYDKKSFYASSASTIVSQGLFYSNDLVNWTVVNASGLPATFTYSSIALDQNGVLFAVISESAGGLSLYKIAFETAAKIIDPIKPTSPRTALFYKGKIYVYDGMGAIYETSDSGLTWQTISAPAGNLLTISNDYFFIPSSNTVLWLSRNAGATWQSVGENLIPNSNFADVIVNEYDGYAYAAMTNNVAKKSQVVIMTNDGSIPVSTTFSPAPNSTGASVNPSIAITFNEAVKKITGKKLRIFDLANPGISIETIDMSTAVQDGKKFTVTPTTILSFNKTYFITMDLGSLEDIFGNKYAGISTNNTWRFTTKAMPTVTTLSPANSEVNISITTTLAITFSESMTGVAGANVKVNTGVSTTIASVDASTGVVTGNTITYTLPAALSYSTGYFIKIDPNAFTTVDGGTISVFTTDNSWNFTTQSAPDTQSPVIAFTSITIQKGTATKFQPTVTDNSGNVSAVKLHHRPATSSDAYTESALAAVLPLETGKWEITIDETWLDVMGMEYYFTAADISGNSGRLPLNSGIFSLTLSFSTAPSISSTALSFGGNAANYRIFSIPYQLSDDKIATIFNEVNNGNPDKTLWRLVTYGGGTSWLEYASDLNNLSIGKGYWINIRNSVDIKVEGATTPNYNRYNLYTMTLNPGWNQIGNPYTTDISWNEIKVQDPNIGTLKVYSGTAYSNGDVLKPFEGGFVFLSGTIPVAAKILFKGIPIGGRTARENQSSNLAQDSWRVPIMLRQDDFTNEFSGIGMDPAAKQDWDQFDDLNVPRFIDYLEMNFDHPESVIRKFARDVVPLQDSYSWEFTVESNRKGMADLLWDNQGYGNNNKELFLLDINRQMLIDMRSEDHLQFDAAQSFRFRIYYGEDLKNKIKPAWVMLGDAYPNPSSGTAIIPFNLPESSTPDGLYQVRLEVFDMMGRKVSVLVDRELPAGFYQGNWIEEGLSNGLYTYRLSVNSGKKQEVQSGKVLMNK